MNEQEPVTNWNPTAPLANLDNAVSGMERVVRLSTPSRVPEGFADDLLAFLLEVEERAAQLAQSQPEVERVVLTSIGIEIQQTGGQEHLAWHGRQLDLPPLLTGIVKKAYTTTGEIRTDELLDELNQASEDPEPLTLDDVHALIVRFKTTLEGFGKAAATSWSYALVEGAPYWLLRGYPDGSYPVIARAVSAMIGQITDGVVIIDPEAAAGRGIKVFQSIVRATVAAGVDPLVYQTTGLEPDKDNWEAYKACEPDSLHIVNPPDAPEKDQARAVREEQARNVCAGCVVRRQCALSDLVRKPGPGVRGGLTSDERSTVNLNKSLMKSKEP